MAFLTDDGPGVDFDDLYHVWNKLSQVEGDILTSERQLDEYRALAQREALHSTGTDKKKPTVYELSNIVYHLGNNEEQLDTISKLTLHLAELTATRIKLKGELDTMHKKIAVWQTTSANQRRTLIE